MAELLRIYNDPPNPKAIQRVVNCLKNGGIVIFPSDTVYALGCAAHEKKAVERLRMIDGKKKGRSGYEFYLSRFEPNQPNDQTPGATSI